MTNLDSNYEQQIKDLIEAKNLIAAIKLYREMTGAGLAEAKQVVETMAQGGSTAPLSEMQQSTDPIMDAKIRSLLSQRQKIEAVKIYREEYGVGLKEAKDAVDRIEAGMKRSDSFMNMDMPYESAIGEDPFAEKSPGNVRNLIVLIALIALIGCGAAVFFLAMNS